MAAEMPDASATPVHGRARPPSPVSRGRGAGLLHGLPRPLRVVTLAAGLLLACAAASAGSEGKSARSASGGEPAVELDRLLQLPSGLDYSVERRGGLTAGEWRSRFDELRRALASEQEQLAAAEQRLAEVAGGKDPWKVAPALGGLGGLATGAASDAPVDYGLRQEIRRRREEVDRLERRLRELEIEANLAGVPDTWRESASAEREAEVR